MNARNLLLVITMIVWACASSMAFAAKAPLSPDAMQREAHTIIVATIQKIRIESESSTFEPGFGNSDWGIYLTLELETVEKGDIAEDSVEARCFRIKTRRSVQEYFSPSGHHPIPEVGTRVRVYLRRHNTSWDVVSPNGIAVIGDGQQSSQVVPDAREVRQLRSFAYTFILPLEVLLLLVVCGLAIVIFIVWRRKQSKRVSLAAANDSVVRAETA